MKKVNFIFGVHNHQPVGNFGKVFEDLYRQSYEPFLSILHKHPRVKCVFHVTGPLLEWIEANRPEYFRRLKEMTDRGQVELFTGGMYEPILAVLPDRDKVGQDPDPDRLSQGQVQGRGRGNVAGRTGLGTPFDEEPGRGRGEIYRH